jgi:hypothetical protein
LPASNDDVLVRVKHWEIIADNLSRAGWSWGCVATVDSVKDEQYGLSPQIAAVNASLCVRMKS